MLEDFLGLVDPSIRRRSGGVLYSGRRAFSDDCPIYLLGLNPAGNPVSMAHRSIEQHIAEALERPATEWSEYADVSWAGRPPGGAPMQRRVRHLLKSLGHESRRVPASNVVFVRAARERDLEDQKTALLRACWPVHEAVISRLSVRAVLCMGGTAGRWVRDQTGAHTVEATFVESNDRRWTSVLHSNGQGLRVATLTHPAIAAWDVRSTDPSPLLRALL